LRLLGSRVLIVEDEVIVAMDLQNTLEDEGAEVVGPAYTLDQAIAFASQADISAAILDLRIGRDSAAPVARLLTARNIPFVFYTGQSRSDLLLSEWPKTRVLSKPSPGLELVAAAAAMLSAGSGRREQRESD
jgi:DNA-binding response OmpR family regulator